ncbi:FAD-dependent monooxygenase [Anderseniella sp. Alg231-50]|uniref:FAD-dependent monooxygenase n=1 Tax=Anderseniella sp. Alg231-50 TaxID=1922226 RepID=UPI000D55C49C
MHISIAGAGIAGLASAIALSQNGHSVSVFEQAARLEAIGAGLQLGPNAVRVLENLGVWSELEAQCCAPDRIRICDAISGRQLSELDLGDSFTRKFGSPYRVAHRADLINALAQSASRIADITIVNDCRITGLEPGASTCVKTLSGEAHETDLVVAADGIRSQLRAHIGLENQPRLSGETLYRALAPASDLPAGLDPDAVYLWLAPGAHVVHYRVSGGRRLNIVASIEQPADQTGWNNIASRGDVLAALPGAASALRDLLSAPASWLAWTGADLDPFTSWSRDNCVLVGDAAHASLPYLAQGAAMALEDAECLAACIGDGSGDLTAALVRYESRRQPRTARIIEESRRNAGIYHMRGPKAQARNLALRFMPGSMQMQRLAWIYASPPDNGSPR